MTRSAGDPAGFSAYSESTLKSSVLLYERGVELGWDDPYEYMGIELGMKATSAKHRIMAARRRGLLPDSCPVEGCLLTRSHKHCPGFDESIPGGGPCDFLIKASQTRCVYCEEDIANAFRPPLDWTWSLAS